MKQETDAVLDNPGPEVTSPSPRVAIYIRVSRNSEANPDTHEGSLHSQLTQMILWLITKGYAAVALYMDDGQTGDALRPGLDRLLEAASAPLRPFDFVVVYGLARFSRHAIRYAHMEQKHRAANVSILCSTAAATADDDARQLVKQVLESPDNDASAQAHAK